MPLVSSPVAYPPSSSPPAVIDSRKRTRPDEHHLPVKRKLLVFSDKDILRGLNSHEINRRNSINDTQEANPKIQIAPKTYGPFIEDLDEPEDLTGLALFRSAAKLPDISTWDPPRKLGPFIEEDDDETEDPAILDILRSTAKATPETSNLDQQKNQGPFIDVNNENEKADPTVQGMLRFPPDACPEIPHMESSYTKTRHSVPTGRGHEGLMLRTSSGKSFKLKEKTTHAALSYEQLIAGRSITITDKATRSFYGIDIHHLLDQAINECPPAHTPFCKRQEETPRPSFEPTYSARIDGSARTMMWTEKYRAKKFADLVGDERTHRNVLRWLKGWDPIVFPGSCKAKPKNNPLNEGEDVLLHRKILLLTGPPGLGKTTLAHVCARQAGYEVVEINASDERSRDVVKGRIKDSVGTETVKGVNVKNGGGTVRKSGRPLCVVVDEVDGVAGGSGVGGEGGFIKALIDLVALDQKNSTSSMSMTGTKRSKKGDQFRLLRPMILICNDVYHPSLRPLRNSSIAEIIHVRRPPLDKVVARLKAVFEKEGLACDGDGVRRLCEATWGISNRRENRLISSNTGEGDIRGILVVGEWAATKMRASQASSAVKTGRLTKKWVEDHILQGISYGGGADRVLGRGGTREVVQRIFVEGAGFPKYDTVATDEISNQQTRHSLGGISEFAKGRAMERLRNVLDACGETDRIVTDCFAAYPSQSFQDDMFLTKPNAAYDWLHFHDSLSTRVFSGQEWELSPYLSEAMLGFHYLFASRPQSQWSSDQRRWDDEQEDGLMPFSGLRADYEASEAQKQNKAILQGLRSVLSIHLLRTFRSPEEISIEFLPSLLKILTPDVKPVMVGGNGDQRGVVSVRNEAERSLIQRAVGAMSAVGVTFERCRVESGGQTYGNNYIYRMEPPIDLLTTFETVSRGQLAAAPTRYGVRQVLDQEYQKYLLRQSADMRQARYRAGGLPGQPASADTAGDVIQLEAGKNKASKLSSAVKRDFFGRVIEDARPAPTKDDDLGKKQVKRSSTVREGNEVWVSFHEGFSNAVRKPITMDELMKGF